MRKVIILILATLVFITSCDILDQFGEVKRFAECDFYISEVQFIKLGGIDISEYKTASDFGFSDMIFLGQQILTNELPATVKVNIEAKNNHASIAAISGLSWKLFMKNEQYGNGELTEYIEIPPSESTVFPVTVEFDFIKLLKSEKLQSIIDLIVDIGNEDKLQKLDIVLKIKPYYKSGNQIKEYPGYLSIKP